MNTRLFNSGSNEVNYVDLLIMKLAIDNCSAFKCGEVLLIAQCNVYRIKKPSAFTVVPTKPCYQARGQPEEGR